MENEAEEFEQPERISRRDLLRLGVIGAGAILSATLAPVLVKELLNPETAIERSNEFNKTPDWQYNFADMDDTRLDTSVWRYEDSPGVPGYNEEKQAYTSSPENVRIEPGTGLVIEAHKRNYMYANDPEYRQYEYTSGRIDTRNSMSFEYGKIEATMKFPEGKGVWPAFWLLSSNEVHTADWNVTQEQREEEGFYKHNGEIDVVEYYGGSPGQIDGTAHTFNSKITKILPVEGVTTSFHTYGVEITPDRVIWTFDDAPYHQFVKPSDHPDDWPFGNNNQLYVILNLALGGTAGEIDDKKAPWRLEVANVEFYDYNGERP